MECWEEFHRDARLLYTSKHGNIKEYLKCNLDKIIL